MTRKEQCLQRLFDLTTCFAEMVDFLFNEKLISEEQIQDLKLEVDKVNFLYNLLKEHEKKEKINLLSFDWIMLPEERIKVTIITDRAVQDFSYRF